MSRVEAIILDKDGTLFDFQATWVRPFLGLLDRIPDPSKRASAAELLMFDVEGLKFHPDSPVIAETTGVAAGLLAPVLGCDHGEAVALLNSVGGDARQVPAVPLRPCLQDLKTRHCLGLVTNDSEVSARAHLDQEDILDQFAFVAGYDSGFGAKPEPGQLLAFCDATGFAADVTCMVGDSRHDLAAGRAAGMRTVGVLTGVATADDLADLADVVLPDIGHLADWAGAQT